MKVLASWPNRPLTITGRWLGVSREPAAGMVGRFHLTKRLVLVRHGALSPSVLAGR